MPWPEMLTKDFKALILIVRGVFQGSKAKTILCYPHFPSKGSTIARIAKFEGWQITNKRSRKFQIGVFWEYGTVRVEDEPLKGLDMPIINLKSLNISKDFVDEHMNRTFGYSTRIDPENATGSAVKKSNTNAVHDGQLIRCPINREEGFIYQKFIDSSVNDREVMDIRVVVMNHQIPHVYLNYRSNRERFKNVPDRAVLVAEVDRFLSAEEQTLILEFCRSIGLDYGELDVLRDKDDQRIYIVDANNTPQGPPKNLSAQDKAKAIELLAKSFREEFLS